MTIEMAYLPITKELFKRVERIASLRNQDIDSMLDELLSRVEEIEDSDEARMAQEEEYFLTMLPSLQAKYLNQFIALFEGKLVDNDSDELELLGRIESSYPGKVVLIKRVTETIEPPLMVRSPRLVPES